ncbi:SdpI family protein [Paeniglutamicibacter kerguelensis]|uniref:SdpI family protein n=1 Tax=Paeniglutamicibacter kerguelensis TaxID=254788 RepID=UPI00361962D8
MTELITTVFMLLLMVGLGWSMKAAATGQIKRNSWIGIRTAATMHCDQCWLLGHHAAAHKGMLGVVAAGVVMALGSVAALIPAMPGFLYPASLLLGCVLLLSGVLLGAKDARWATSKIHAGEQKSPA